MKALFLMFIALLVVCASSCSSVVLVKDCEHKGSGVYECEKL